MPAPKWFSSTSTRPRSTPVDPGPALERASEQLSDEPADIGAHTWAGATDPEVAPETLRGVLQREPRVDDLGRLYARCLHYLAEDLWESSGYRALPGAEAPLVALGDAGATLGLVSGAMEGAPRTKLMAANLNRSFTFGAHGSDSPERSELTRLATERATRLHELGRARRHRRGRRHPPRHEGGARGRRNRGAVRPQAVTRATTSKRSAVRSSCAPLRETFPGLQPDGGSGV